MSITRKQFDLGIDQEIEEWIKKIYAFFLKHKDEAFTDRELATNLEAIPQYAESAQPPVLYQAFILALEKMMEWGVAEKRKVKGMEYYSYGSEPLEKFLG